MWIIAVVLALLIALWLGLRVKPVPFPAYHAESLPPKQMTLPDDLPVPVARFFKAAIGEQIPVIHSAVITGSGRLTFKGISFNSRWRFTHDAGRGYHHYIETTIFGYPLLKVNEWFLDGTSRLELPFGIVGAGAKTDTAAALGLWAESVWLPSILITDPRLHWEAIDDTSARLIIPSGEGEDSLVFSFDPQTGLIRQLEAIRWRDEKDAAKLRWTDHVTGWRTFHGVQVPSPTSINWEDMDSAWFTPVVEDIAYNVDVSEIIRGRGV